MAALLSLKYPEVHLSVPPLVRLSVPAVTVVLRSSSQSAAPFKPVAQPGVIIVINYLQVCQFM